MVDLFEDGEEASAVSDFFDGETLVLIVALVVEGVLASVARDALLDCPEGETEGSLVVIGGIDALPDIGGTWRIWLAELEVAPWLEVEVFDPAVMLDAGFGKEDDKGAIGARVLFFLSTLLLLLKMSGLFNWLI